MDPDQVVNKCRVISTPIGEKLYRLQLTGHSSSLYFGCDAKFRWDAPDNSYGVLYLGDTVDTSFAETFGHAVSQEYQIAEDKFIELGDLANRTLYEVTVHQKLKIADMTGEALVKLNLDAGFISSSDYALPQAVSKALYSAGFDGIAYQSRALPSGKCLALFETAKKAIREKDLGLILYWENPLSGRDIYDILEDHGWLLVNDGN